MSTSTLDRNGTQTEAGHDDIAAREALRQCQTIRQKIKGDLTSAVADSRNLLLAQDLKMWGQCITDTELEKAGFKTPEQKAKALAENIPWVEQNIREARQWGQMFHAEIEDAVRSGALTEENARHARSIALNRNGDWTTVKQFFTGSGSDTFQSWKSNWKYMTDIRKKAKDLQSKLKCPNDATPALKAFHSSSGKFEKRMQDAEKAVHSLVDLEAKNSSALGEARRMLRGAVTAKALSSSKVDGWIAHIFTRYKGEAAARFIDNKLPSFIEDWKDVAEEFRHFLPLCKEKGVDTPSEEAFLSMSYESRKSKVRQMRSSLSGETEPQEKKHEAGYLKMKIRFALATKDPERAEELVEKLGFDHPDDGDLLRLEEEVAKLKTESPAVKPEADQEKPPLPELQEKMWGFLEQMGDHNMRGLLHTALMSQDLDIIEGMMQMLFNRYWCRQHGYLDDDVEFREAKNKDNKEQTKEYMEEGHTRFIERNIVSGDTAHASSIREENSKAQLIFVSHEQTAHDAVVKRISQHKHEKHGGLRYWGTLVTTDTQQNVREFAHTKHFVENIYYPMRSVIRTFMRRGGKFQRRGSTLSPYEKAQKTSVN